ncbi:MAG: hypothetical protein ABSE63_09740 [Thermoguttaceae bacterium]
MFFTPATAQEKKPADKASTDKYWSYQQPSTESDMPLWLKNDPYGGLPGYYQLQFEFVRKELKLTSEQEKKLREIADDFQKYSKRYNQEIEDEAKTLQPQQPMPKKIQMAAAELQQKMKDVRKQIEELLTREQMALLKGFVLQNDVFSLQLNPQWYQTLGISEDQKKELERLFEELTIKTWQLGRNKTEKILGALSPQQRDKLNEITGSEIGTEIFYRPGGDDSFNVYDALAMGNIHQELNLSPQTSRKIKAICAKYSQMASKELPEQKQGMSKLTIVDDQRMKPERELQEIEKQMREEIDPLLTPQQWATLKKISLDERAYRLLVNSRILKKIDVSEEQQKEFLRIRVEIFETIFKSTYETGEKALAVLTPQQREKFEKAMNHGREFSATDASEMMSVRAEMTKSGNGGIIINSNTPDNTMTNTITFIETSPADAAKPGYEKQPLIKSGAGMIIVGNVGNSTAEPQAKQPAGGARVSAGTLAPPADFIDLPAYNGIWEPKLKKQLDITSEQENKLREISRAYVSEHTNLGHEAENLPVNESEKQAKREEINRKWEQLKTEVRKQMEEVLTPQQLDGYKKIVLPLMTVELLQDPQVFKSVGVTPWQKEELWQLNTEFIQRTEGDARERTDRSLALLSEKQLEKLRAEFERRYRRSLESGAVISAADESPASASTTAHLTYTAGSFTNQALWSVEDDEIGYYFVPVYDKLSSPAIRRSLGLSGDHEKQLKEIAGKYDNAIQKLYQEIQKLPPEEQTKKQPELREESLRMQKQVRRQIEALITPDQLAKLKNRMFNGWAIIRLMDDHVQEEIGLSAQQKTALNRISLISQDRQDKVGLISQEMCEKELAVFTPQQQDILREELVRHGW